MSDNDERPAKRARIDNPVQISVDNQQTHQSSTMEIDARNDSETQILSLSESFTYNVSTAAVSTSFGSQPSEVGTEYNKTLLQLEEAVRNLTQLANNAHSNESRVGRLFDEKQASRQEYSEARNDAKQAQTKLEQAQAKVQQHKALGKVLYSWKTWMDVTSTVLAQPKLLFAQLVSFFEAFDEQILQEQQNDLVAGWRGVRNRRLWGTYSKADRRTAPVSGKTIGDLMTPIHDFVGNPPIRVPDRSGEALERKRSVGVALSAPGGGKTHLFDDASEYLSSKFVVGKKVVLASVAQQADGPVLAVLPIKVTFNSTQVYTMVQHELPFRVAFSFLYGCSQSPPLTLRNAVVKVWPTDLTLERVVTALEAGLIDQIHQQHELSLSGVRSVFLVDEVAEATSALDVYNVLMNVADNKDRQALFTTLDTNPVMCEYTNRSKRKIKYFELPLLDVPMFIDNFLTAAEAKTVRPLLLMTQGHWRTASWLAIELEKRTSEGKSLDKKEIPAIVQALAAELRDEGRRDASWYFGAFARKSFPWITVADGEPNRTEFAHAAASGSVLNTLGRDKTALDSEIPLVSLYAAASETFSKQNWPHLYSLALRLTDVGSGKGFEEAFVAHLALLFKLHKLARDAPKECFLRERLPDLKLFAIREGAVDELGPKVLLSNLTLGCQTHANLFNLEVDLASTTTSPAILVLNRLCTLYDSSWQVADEHCFASEKQSTDLPFGAVIYFAHPTHPGCDSALALKLNNDSTHLVLFENKYSEITSDTSLGATEIKNKIRIVADNLGSIFQQSHPLFQFGIKKPQQVTLVFVALRKVSGTFNKTVEDAIAKLDDAARFNVLLMDETAVTNHFGPSLKPAVAIYRHYEGEAEPRRLQERINRAQQALDEARATSNGDAERKAQKQLEAAKAAKSKFEAKL